MTLNPRAEWIAVDWGTSRMRACAVGADGAVLEESPAGPGMGSLEPDDYEPTLLAAIGPQLDARTAERPLDVLVCGMAGARQGWREAPYVPLPATLKGLLGKAVEVPVSDARLKVRIVPGLCREGGEPDVMRGEETQLLGLITREGLSDAVVCLPGTHSKWVRIASGSVEAFSTHMTGELHALLAERSILRHSIPNGGDGAFDEDTFDTAVAEAVEAKGAVLDRLFAIRAAGLVGDGATPSAAAARLSGLLIGGEIARAQIASAVHVIAAGSLARLYERALRAVDVRAIVHDGGALALAGLARMRQEHVERGD